MDLADRRLLARAAPGPAFADSLRAIGDMVPDFFRESVSARNGHERRPIYADQRQTARLYLDAALNESRSYIFANAHPPTSLVLAAPLVKLDFSRVFFAWNLIPLAALAASPWIVQRQLRITFLPWSIAPVLSLLSLCRPPWEHSRLGQLTSVLLLLLTGSRAAERASRTRPAGVPLGAASAIKLLPFFLLVYFALRRRWRVATARLLATAGLIAVTFIMLGFSACRSYFLTVLPEIHWFRPGLDDDSIWGLWSRPFGPALDANATDRSRNHCSTGPHWGLPMIPAAKLAAIAARGCDGKRPRGAAI